MCITIHFSGRSRGNLDRLVTRELDFIRRHKLVSCSPADSMLGYRRQRSEVMIDVRPKKAFEQ